MRRRFSHTRADARLDARETLVLCYHAVSEAWDVPWAVTPTQLRDQLTFVVDRGYRGVTFSEAVTTGPDGPLAVAVTFDDAFGSVHDLAYPILSSLGLPGTVFVVTDFADGDQPLEWPGMEGWTGGRYDSEVRGLGWQELDRLAAAGWEVGSHTRTHPRLTQLDDDSLAEELVVSRAACERALRRPCRSVAYPYGDFDDRVVAAAREAGYDAGATLPVGMSRPSLFAWRRTGIYRKDSLRRFRLKVSPTLCRVRETLAPVEAFVRA